VRGARCPRCPEVLYWNTLPALFARSFCSNQITGNAGRRGWACIPDVAGKCSLQTDSFVIAVVAVALVLHPPLPYHVPE
jgi:hypothetical protein